MSQNMLLYHFLQVITKKKRQFKTSHRQLLKAQRYFQRPPEMHFTSLRKAKRSWAERGVSCTKQSLGQDRALAPPGGRDRRFQKTGWLSNSQIQKGLRNHIRVFGLDSKETTESVSRLQTARTRPHCCQLNPNASNLEVHDKYSE